MGTEGGANGQEVSALSPPGKGGRPLFTEYGQSHLSGGLNRLHLPQKPHSALGCRQVLGVQRAGREGGGGRQTTHHVLAESQDDDSVGWGQESDFSPWFPCHRNQNCIFPPMALLGTSEFLESCRGEVEPSTVVIRLKKEKKASVADVPKLARQPW